MTPKPFLQPHPRRLPRGRAVTIVAGFKCKDGVVLCADTQETIESSKIWTPKLSFEPRDMDSYDGASELMAIFAGSGEGPFVDKVVQRIWEDLQLVATFDEACDEAETSIKKTYKEYGQIFQPGYCPYAKVLYGLKMDGQSKLFQADGAIVTEKTTYSVGGIGQHLSEFLCSRMYGENLTLSQAVILASYVVLQAIEHVDGCGGDQHIAVLRNTGGSEVVDPVTLKGIASHLRGVDSESARALLVAVNLELPEDDYKSWIEHLRLLFAATREMHREELGAWPRIKSAVIEHEKAKRQVPNKRSTGPRINQRKLR